MRTGAGDVIARCASAGVEDDGDAPRGELAAVVAEDERIEKARRVGGLALGDDDELVAIDARQVVEAPAGEADVARAGEKAGRGAVARRRRRRARRGAAIACAAYSIAALASRPLGAAQADGAGRGG